MTTKQRPRAGTIIFSALMAFSLLVPVNNSQEAGAFAEESPSNISSGVSLTTAPSDVVLIPSATSLTDTKGETSSLADTKPTNERT